MVREQILSKLKSALKKLDLEIDLIPLNHPANPEHGDYATSIALQLSKQNNISPFDLAKKIADALPQDELIDRVEAVKPGFINIWISQKALMQEMNRLSSKEDLSSPTRTSQTILLEYGQPNTHKIPHIGHLFSYIYGESLARIFEKSGQKVIRANYQGDVGLHVAKCLWQYQKKHGELSQNDLKNKIDFLQTCYEEGSKAYEQKEQAKKEIDELNNKIYLKDKSVMPLWKETRQWSVDYYKDFEKKLGIKYSKHYFESETSALGKEIVEKNIGTVFERSDGAVIFKGEDHGLHTRVFLNKFGNPTYEAKDVGLISLKKNDYTFDTSIVTTANEQSAYAQVVIKVSELLYPELKGKLKHLGYGMINLSTGKMSSRTGSIIDAFSLVQTVNTSIKDSFNINEQRTIEVIGLSAIKYSFLKSDPFKNIVFDIQRSVAKEGDSGPYMLYTYVRTQSILKQVDTFNDVIDGGELTAEETALLRKFYIFPEVIEQAAKFYSPSFIATYLFELAQSYNLFYQKNPVLKAEENKRNMRLLITKAASSIIKQGLYLLGIETVEKM